jgi:hypothetical protein
MNLKFGASLAALAVLVLLAACGQSGTSYNPSMPQAYANGVPNTGNPPPPPPPSEPSFSLESDGASPRLFGADASSSTAESLKATTFVLERHCHDGRHCKKKKKQFVDIVNAVSGCPLTDDNGVAQGCEVVAASVKVFNIKKSTFDLYAGADATGCILATAAFKGHIQEGKVLPLTFKAINTGTCW